LLKALPLLFLAPPMAFAQARPQVVMFKNASCVCCGQWEKHMRGAGFNVDARTLADVGPVKRNLGVPESLSSCHTATVEGYVIEGHVPAEDVRRLLRERPQITGLAVPGMPSDAPGMDQRRGQPYQTVAFDARRSWSFAQH